MGGLMSEQPDIDIVASAATSTGAISAEVAVDAYVRMPQCGWFTQVSSSAISRS
jgi:hypothetical protein